MKDISREVDLLQVTLDALDGPTFQSGEAPKVLIGRVIFDPAAYYYVHMACDTTFLIREIEQLKDARLIVPLVRTRLVQAYREMQKKIEQTIARLEGKN